MIKRKSGFLISELLIVVAIIAVLVSLAFSNIQYYRNKAQTHACIANLREIDNNISLWAVINGKTGSDTVSMSDLIPAYLKTTPYCPLDAAKQGYVLTTVTEKPQCPCNPESHVIN